MKNSSCSKTVRYKNPDMLLLDLGTFFSNLNAMKTLILALTVVFSLPVLPVQAASQEEETRFLSAAKDAFAKHDANALVAMTCWDRVPEKLKKDGKQQYMTIVAGPSAVDFKLLDHPKLEWNVDDDARFVEIDPAWKESGIVYHSNLPVVKQLKITFAPLKSGGGTSVTISVTYPVGEKDGKLYLVEPAPVK
jgi:hypothetical protein